MNRLKMIAFLVRHGVQDMDGFSDEVLELSCLDVLEGRLPCPAIGKIALEIDLLKAKDRAALANKEVADLTARLATISRCPAPTTAPARAVRPHGNSRAVRQLRKIEKLEARTPTDALSAFGDFVPWDT